MVFDDLAKQLTAEYELFLFALSGRYQTLRSPGVEITPRSIALLSQGAHTLLQTFYKTAKSSIEEYLRTMLADASDELAAALTERKMLLLAGVRAMLLENVQHVVHQARFGGHGVQDLLMGTSGAIGSLVQLRVGRIEFRATDTAGRKWDAHKLFHITVRDFAYQAWLDNEADRLLAAGVDVVETQNGAVMSLSGAPGYESFADVRGAVFHFNSTQIMVPHVSS